MAKTSKNLGLVQAIFVGTTPPNNIFQIWHNLGDSLPYFYNTLTATWETLVSTVDVSTLENVLAQGNTTGAKNISITSGQNITYNEGLGGTLVSAITTVGIKTWTLPNKSGTIALLADIPAPDGNGFKDGSGTIPTTTVATITDNFTLYKVVGTTVAGAYPIRKLDGVASPSITTTVGSDYTEYSPVENLSGLPFYAKGNVITPNLSGNSNAMYSAVGNQLLFTGNLNNLTSTIALNASENGVIIATATGSLAGRVDVHRSTFNNIVTGGVVAAVANYTAVGMSPFVTHLGTTSILYGFHMADQSPVAGNVPTPSNRYGLYLNDDSNNYIRGRLGIGVVTTTEKVRLRGETNNPSNVSLLIENLSGTAAMTVYDETKVEVNGIFSTQSKVLAAVTGVAPATSPVLGATAYTVGVAASFGVGTITMPAPEADRIIIFQNVDNSANVVSIATPSGLINGVAGPITLTTGIGKVAYAASDGTDWYLHT